MTRATDIIKSEGWTKQKPSVFHGKHAWRNKYGNWVSLAKVRSGVGYVVFMNEGNAHFKTEKEAFDFVKKYTSGQVKIK